MPGKDIAIDLGTSTVKVFVKGKGIVMSFANAVSFDSYTDEVIAIGDEAMKMKGKMPSTVELETPIKSGVIADFSVMRLILQHVIDKICARELFKPGVIISAPSSCTALEKKTIIDVVCAAGAGKVSVIEEPIASALGCAMNIERPYGILVIDIGAGTSDIAVITMGSVAFSSSLKIAGDDMDEAIIQFVKKEKNIIIGTATAQKIKHTVGCASKMDEQLEMSVSGKDFVTGMPVVFTVNSDEICAALSDTVKTIIEETKAVLEQIPAQMFSDICQDGIVLTGGCAKLHNIANAFADRFGLKTTVAADCENTAAKGAGYALKKLAEFDDNGYIYKIKENMSAI